MTPRAEGKVARAGTVRFLRGKETTISQTFLGAEGNLVKGWRSGRRVEGGLALFEGILACAAGFFLSLLLSDWERMALGAVLGSPRIPVSESSVWQNHGVTAETVSSTVESPYWRKSTIS